MNTAQPPDRPGRTRTYFTLGVIFLFLMALFWSVDDSIVYIFLGLAAAFLFFGFYSLPRTVSSHRGPFQQQYRSSGNATTFGDAIRNIFQQRSAQSSHRPQGQQQVVRKRVITLVIGLFLFVFFLPIVITMLGSGGGDNMTAANYYDLAESQYQQQQYDSAHINYRRAWRMDETYKEAITGYGNTLVTRNESDSALLMFDKALAIDPDYSQASYSKAYAYYSQKKYRQAQEVMTPVIAAHPDYYQGMLLLGDSFYEDKKYDEAIAQYERAYNDGGMRGNNLCYIMGYIYETKGQNDKAIALYQEALSYDSTVADLYDRLGKLIPGDNGNFYRTKAAELQ